MENETKLMQMVSIQLYWHVVNYWHNKIDYMRQVGCFIPYDVEEKFIKSRLSSISKIIQ